MEQLEDRTLLSTVNWVNPAGGDWDTASNWDSGLIPGPADDVVINLPGITVTHSSGVSDSINSLTSQDAIDFSAGSLTLAATSTINNSLSFSGGTLDGSGDLTLTGLVSWSGGTMGGTGTTTVAATGALNVDGSYAALDDSRILDNFGTLTWTGGRWDFFGTAVLNNESGATFDVQTDAGINQFNSGVINNAGTFEKSAGTGTARIGVPVNNANSLQALSGTLNLDAGGTSTGSFTSVAGASLNFSGGTHTLSAAAGVSGTGTVGFLGGTTAINGSYNVSGTTHIASGEVDFNNTAASGAVTLSGGTFAGSEVVHAGDIRSCEQAGSGDLGPTGEPNCRFGFVHGAYFFLDG